MNSIECLLLNYCFFSMHSSYKVCPLLAKQTILLVVVVFFHATFFMQTFLVLSHPIYAILFMPHAGNNVTIQQETMMMFTSFEVFRMEWVV
jgi:hypothetical protein